MICTLALHYTAYKVHDLLRLTPRQLYAMAVALAKKRAEDVKTLALILGAKVEDEPEDGLSAGGDDYRGEVDHARLDRMSQGHVALLQRKAAERCQIPS